MALANLKTLPQYPDPIDADEARAAAAGFLLDHVGNQLSTGQPLRMISAVSSTWIVPIQLGYVHTGGLGNVGVMAVDEETGQVMAWTPIDQMKEASCTLREAHEPELTAQFAEFMTASAKIPHPVIQSSL